MPVRDDGIGLKQLHWHGILRHIWEDNACRVLAGEADAKVRVVSSPGAVSIMVIAAHPDDLESWCASTIACAVANGATARLLLVTSGDNGKGHRSSSAPLVGMDREAEAQQTARSLGVTDVVFLRQPNGAVEDTRTLHDQLGAWIRRWRPQLLFTHDPIYPLPVSFHRDHCVTSRAALEDHRVTGRAVLAAVSMMTCDPCSVPEHEKLSSTSHTVEEIWLFASAVTDAYVDITRGLDRTINARLALERRTQAPQMLANIWRTRSESIGARCGLPVAEVFRILHVR